MYFSFHDFNHGCIYPVSLSVSFSACLSLVFCLPVSLPFFFLYFDVDTFREKNERNGGGGGEEREREREIVEDLGIFIKLML